MTSKRRTNDLIVSQILKLCVPGASKTRVVYQANLNFLTVNPYLNNLIKNECIEVVHVAPGLSIKLRQKGWI